MPGRKVLPFTRCAAFCSEGWLNCTARLVGHMCIKIPNQGNSVRSNTSVQLQPLHCFSNVIQHSTIASRASNAVARRNIHPCNNHLALARDTQSRRHKVCTVNSGQANHPGSNSNNNATTRRSQTACSGVSRSRPLGLQPCLRAQVTHYHAMHWAMGFSQHENIRQYPRSLKRSGQKKSFVLTPTIAIPFKNCQVSMFGDLVSSWASPSLPPWQCCLSGSAPSVGLSRCLHATHFSIIVNKIRGIIRCCSGISCWSLANSGWWTNSSICTRLSWMGCT